MSSLLVMFATAFNQTAIYKAQAMYIYDIIYLSEWPKEEYSGAFTIGILGNETLANELQEYTKTKKINNDNIDIINYSSISEVESCNVLFVSFSYTRQMSNILSIIDDKGTLIISEKNGALKQGAAINFIIRHDQLKFELSEENADRYGIKLSKKLMDMAIVAQL